MKCNDCDNKKSFRKGDVEERCKACKQTESHIFFCLSLSDYEVNQVADKIQWHKRKIEIADSKIQYHQKEIERLEAFRRT